MTTANKALLAALLAGLASILGDLRGADSTLTFQDWVVVVLAALVTGIGVYLVPNYTRGGARKEGGAVSPQYVFWCLACVAVAIVIIILVA